MGDARPQKEPATAVVPEGSGHGSTPAGGGQPPILHGLDCQEGVRAANQDQGLGPTPGAQGEG